MACDRIDLLSFLQNQSAKLYNPRFSYTHESAGYSPARFAPMCCQSGGQLWADANSSRISFTQQIKSRFLSSSACMIICLIVSSMFLIPLSFDLFSGSKKEPVFRLALKPYLKKLYLGILHKYTRVFLYFQWENICGEIQRQKNFRLPNSIRYAILCKWSSRVTRW